MESNLDQMYREVILDHHRFPRNVEALQKPTFHAEGYNPLCGDKIELEIEIDSNKVIKAMSSKSCGCSISIASGSIMSEEVLGKTLMEARQEVDDFRAVMAGKKQFESSTGDVEALEGVKKFPVRIKCALLSWATLAQGIDEYLGKTAHLVAKTEDGT